MFRKWCLENDVNCMRLITFVMYNKHCQQLPNSTERTVHCTMHPPVHSAMLYILLCISTQP